MKALLLKDFYTLKTNGRSYLLPMGLMIVLALLTNNTQFFLLYAMLFGSMIPISFYSMDEKDGWETYSRTLPYSKGNIVNTTYVFSLLIVCALTLMSAVVYIFKYIGQPDMASLQQTGMFMLALMGAGLLPSILIYPAIFWLGSEKGRVAYIAIFVACAFLFGFLFENLDGLVLQGIPAELLSGFLFMFLYLAAWKLSAVLYTQRMERL